MWKSTIKQIERTELDIEDKGKIEYYMGINVKEQDNGKINLIQPQIINSIINDVRSPKNTVP